MGIHNGVLVIFIFPFFVASLTVSASAASNRCHPNDYKTLIQIKNAFNNPYQLASWTPNTDCCSWYCLECDETTNRVIVLGIFQAAISSQIPSQIGDLEYLQRLTLRKITNLTGPVPRSLTKLKHLTSLRLSWLNLTGPVPDFLSELTNLTFLELNFNKFTGSIPPSFSKFTQLGALHLDRNQLTGTIPESFGHFSGLVPSLYLSHNQLSGSIPESFANMDFDTIDLSRNKLVGDASMLFGANKLAQIIDISRNLFEFDFSKVKIPNQGLIWLDINHNKIYGSIPKEIVEVHLQVWNASYNQLCGEIPTGGGFDGFAFDRSDSSIYIHNKCLCGPPLAPCKSN